MESEATPLLLGVGLCAAVLLFHAVAPVRGQSPESRQATRGASASDEPANTEGTPGVPLSEKEAEQLWRQLEQTAYSPMTVVPVTDSPISIREARIRCVRRAEGTKGSRAAENVTFSESVMEARLIISNNGSKRLDAIGLEFTNTQAKEIFYLYPDQLLVDAKRIHQVITPFLVVSGDPHLLAIRLVGAQFQDRKSWGAFPDPPKWPLFAPGATDLDYKPAMLASPAFLMTNTAANHGVLGTLVLRFEVGSDGSVRTVRIVNVLPDGLTEAAIANVRQMRFSPALKNGQPVPCWFEMVMVRLAPRNTNGGASWVTEATFRPVRE